MNRILLVVLLAMVAASSHAGDSCKARFGEVAVVEHCDRVVLPGFEVRATGSSQPNPKLPLHCRNYTAGAGADSANFKQCSTGLLGGHAYFELGAKVYTVVFDVAAGCGKAPAGNWAPMPRGHVFYEGKLTNDELAKQAQTASQADSECLHRQRQP